MLKLLKKLNQIKVLGKVIGWHEGGIHKRIDENRELLELLAKESPEFLAKHPEVMRWLKSNDVFFIAISDSIKLKECQFNPTTTQSLRKFPRPWPEHKM